MALYVKKFGGSSVATTERMKNIASRILREKHDNDKIVIVVSAMGDSTDDLLALASQVPSLRHGRDGYVAVYRRTGLDLSFGDDLQKLRGTCNIFDGDAGRSFL